MIERKEDEGLIIQPREGARAERSRDGRARADAGSAERVREGLGTEEADGPASRGLELAPAPGSVDAPGEELPDSTSQAPARAGAATGEATLAEESAEAQAGPVPPEELRCVLEAILFSVPGPIPLRTLAGLLGQSLHELRAAVEDLRLEYIETRRAFRLEEVGGGLKLLTLPQYEPWIRKLQEKEKEGRLSSAALETLAVIAYKQPIGKADLEGIRGVGCGPILKTLLDRALIQVVGRGEGLGKPILYGTTQRFLESFGLPSVKELPQPELPERLAARLSPEASLATAPFADSARSATPAQAASSAGSASEDAWPTLGEPLADLEELGEPGADASGLEASEGAAAAQAGARGVEDAAEAADAADAADAAEAAPVEESEDEVRLERRLADRPGERGASPPGGWRAMPGGPLS